MAGPVLLLLCLSNICEICQQHTLLASGCCACCAHCCFCAVTDTKSFGNEACLVAQSFCTAGPQSASPACHHCRGAAAWCEPSVTASLPCRSRQSATRSPFCPGPSSSRSSASCCWAPRASSLPGPTGSCRSASGTGEHTALRDIQVHQGAPGLTMPPQCEGDPCRLHGAMSVVQASAGADQRGMPAAAALVQLPAPSVVAGLSSLNVTG